MRFVRSYRFGDEDELHRECHVPSGEVFLIGIGNDGGAYTSERVQHRERFGVELHSRGHLEEEINIGGRIAPRTKPSQYAQQDLFLNFSERPERRHLRRLGVQVGPRPPDVVNRHRQPVISHDTPRDQHQILVPNQRAIGVKEYRLDRHPACSSYVRAYRSRNSRIGVSTFFSSRTPRSSTGRSAPSRVRVASLITISPSPACAARRAAMFVVMPEAVEVQRVPAPPPILVAPSSAGPVLTPTCRATGPKP